ncbi:MAG: beta-CASP ribonuclease aCPSF1 [Thermoproteota archaeon]|nr:MAG: beta-CASP ribonuclease aCPSF1 [Candidatus Korarchaeota archaeon]
MKGCRNIADKSLISSASLKEELKKIVSEYGEVKRIYFEGPFPVVEIVNISDFLENKDIIAELARKVKKRIIVRADRNALMPKEEAQKKILEIVPAEAEVKELHFIDKIGEVFIVAKRTGHVVGKAGAVINSILKSTGWRPIPLRIPTIDSSLTRAIRRQYINRAYKRTRLRRKMSSKVYSRRMNLGKFVTLTFLGGAREVGRSCILLQTGESSILLDCGLNPSGPPFPYFNVPEFDLDTLNGIVVTHAHLDHCGALPLLYKYGYDGPIYCTESTRDLIVLILLDMYRLIGREGGYPYFSMRDITRVFDHTITIGYGEPVDISPDVKLTLYNSGHILGSSLAHLSISQGAFSLLYTGDFRFRNSRLLDRAECKFPRLDALIIESTYGGFQDNKPPLQYAEKKLIEIVKETLNNNGKVLIPALSVGRAQEVMLTIENAFESNMIKRVPVYVDGMIYEATSIHTAYPDHLSRRIKSKVLGADQPIFSPDIFTPIHRQDEREEIVKVKDECIIISPSGMLSGGPVLYYFRCLAPDPKNSVILVSYQAPGTVGRKLQRGIKKVTIPSGHEVEVECTVHNIEGFSGHADRVQLYSYATVVHPKPSKVLIVHGEEHKAEELKRGIQRLYKGRAQVLVPYNMERIRLK